MPHCAVQRSGAVIGIFILSGAAGLIYEIVWSRQLVLVFGNTTQAVSAILTGFFGGMAIGATIGGRIADRVRSPLRLYGLLELVLVVVVLVTPLTFGLINDVYRGIYPALEGDAVPRAGATRPGGPRPGAGHDHDGRHVPGPHPPLHALGGPQPGVRAAVLRQHDWAPWSARSWPASC